ncbi:MAG: aminoglycoside phosphotransferase family protein, partial [Chloroflexi bacterium]|nr:aminoglycoside phosphotransferase family protein [Chloroflexota bacterium]
MGYPPRTVSLVLVTPDGRPVGQLAPFPVATPWWPDVEPIVKDVRDRLGLKVTVLRMLEVEPLLSAGGHVRYLAEVDDPLE